MTEPIQHPPEVTGEDATRFLDEVDRVNELSKIKPKKILSKKEIESVNKFFGYLR